LLYYKIILKNMFSRRAQFTSVTLIAGMMMSFGAGLAHAQVPNLDIDIPTPDVNININPDTPSASEINCQIFAELIANGSPIPPGFDASGCEGGGGGGGGGGSTPACADGVDNDGDNLVDSADPGCTDSNDADESNTPGGGNGGGNGGGGTGGGSGNGGGGNSGGPAPACEDSVDNDGDGLKDMNDPGCSSPSDTDEVNTASGGGSGGGSLASSTVATSTETTSASSTLATVASCDMYLTAFIKPGGKNDSEQVKRLQSLLVEAEGADLEVSGEYDANTVAAVHAFQTKYTADILAPWGVSKSTGFVYLTTRKKVNEIYCKQTKEFPLSNEEVETIAKTKVQITAPTSSARPSAPKAPAQQGVGGAVNENEVGSAAKESQTAAAGETATRSLNRLWDPVTGFFKRVFGR
jgi:hypothetical protein